jgi:uncharacterized protein
MHCSDYRVIDADGHIMERNHEIQSFLPYARRQGEEVRQDTYSLFPSMDGFFRPNLSNPGLRDNPDAAMWLGFLDECGIEQTVLLPTAGLAVGLIEDAAWAVELCAAYNDWMYATYARVSPRFHGVALLPVQDVPSAVAELRRAVTELHFPAAMLPAVNVLNKAYGHSDFWPIHAEAERLGVALTLHGSPGRGLGLDHLQSFIESHTLKEPFSLLIQLTSMLYQGVFEAFPQLRVAYLEAGAGWMPYMLDRMDEEYERRGKRWAPRLTRAPSEYLRRGQVYVSMEPGERTLPTVLEMFGEDYVLFASDYPHERPRPEFSHDIPNFLHRTDVSDTAKRKILCDNARQLYRLD